MRLTQQEREFLERLGTLLDRDQARVSRSAFPPSCLVLASSSWPDAEREMGLSRQAIRRRFWRVFNQLYLPALETVMLVEQRLGPEFLETAIAIVWERLAHIVRGPEADLSFQSADTLLEPHSPATAPASPLPVDGPSSASAPFNP